MDRLRLERKNAEYDEPFKTYTKHTTHKKRGSREGNDVYSTIFHVLKKMQTDRQAGRQRRSKSEMK